MPNTQNSAPDTDSLASWLRWLETLSAHEIELGLERVQTVLKRLELPRPRRVLHVAGTNGKGSTVAMLEALYLERGDSVACYTSPHVVRYNERMRVQGRMVDDAEILASLRRVEAVRDGIPLTYFEFGTLAALVAFAARRADVWVLEIGLGGRLDAVNALDPDAAVITNISLDHCDWLGPDTESIAREKAGVMRRGIPVVYAALQPPAAITQIADELAARLHVAGRDYEVTTNGNRWSYSGSGLFLEGLGKPGLQGRFQICNAAGAVTLYALLEGNIDAATIDRAFGRLRLQGRMQRIDTTRHWLLDVAHNPGAAEVLAETLREDYPGRRLVFVIGVLADKDLAGILRPVLALADAWVAVTPENSRALPASILAARIAEASGKPCRIAATVAEGLDVAECLSNKDDLVVVTGSFFTVGPATEALVPAA
ncbi:MAG: folylpolyglutamate synthase/dihydrofolate synthase family protein [Woeseia sp.]